MSSLPNNGLVTVSFQVDRSAVDSYLAELRKGVTIPIKADYTGPAGPSAPSAAGVAGSNGPATFGNLSGAPVYGSGGSGIFAGGPMQGIAGITMNVGAMGYGAAGGGGNTLGPAATALQQAAQAIQQAAATFQQAAVTAPINNPASPAAPRAPRRPGGGRNPLANIGRYFGVGLMAHELLGEATGAINEQDQYGTAMQLGGSPEQLAQMQLSNAQRQRSGGILGLNPIIYRGFDFLANHGIDPGGIFSEQSRGEKDAIKAIQSARAQQFDYASTNIQRELTHQMQTSGMVNPDISALSDIQFQSEQQQRQINERYEAEKIRRPADRAEIERERQGMIADARTAGLDQMTQKMDQIQFGQKMQFLSAVGDIETSRYLMQGMGESAVRSEAAYERQKLESGRSRNFTYDESGIKAYNAERNRIDADRDRRLDLMRRTGEAEFISQSIQNNSLRIQLGARDPAVGNVLGQVNTMGSQAIFGAYETSQRTDLLDADKTRLEHTQLHHGMLQLEQFRRDFFRSNEPRQISSINQQALNGPGTADVSKVNKDIADQIATLKSIDSNLKNLAKAVEQLTADD